MSRNSTVFMLGLFIVFSISTVFTVCLSVKKLCPCSYNKFKSLINYLTGMGCDIYWIDASVCKNLRSFSIPEIHSKFLQFAPLKL